MKKEYYDEEAYNYIKNKLEITHINSVFRPIVIDIIMRRRAEYELDDKYFHRDVDSFINNVKKIHVKKLKKHKMGCIRYKEKTINLNSDCLKTNMKEIDYEDLYETLTHECYHAMNSNSKGLDRTFEEENDPLKSITNLGVLEIFTEKEADRTIKNRNKNNAFKYRTQTNRI